MKKLWLLFIVSILLVGCSNTNTKLKAQEKVYNVFINELKNANSNLFNNDIPFNINVYLEKVTDDEITYRTIIDEPKVSIKNIKAIVIHNYKTKDIFPTSGIFEAPLNLIPDSVNKKLNDVKGIILVGYIPYKDKLAKFDGVIKVLIKYEDELGNTHEVFYKYQQNETK